MRTNLARKTGPALLDRPEAPRASKRIDEIRRGGAPSEPPRPRREHPGTSTNDPFADEDPGFLRRNRRIRRGLIPQTRTGRIVAGICTVTLLASLAAATFYTRRFLHRDPHFVIPSSAAIELSGNKHLSQSQLLSIFGEDVDQNIFSIPLKQRRDELEQMPWVEHATVMRLLPNHLRVQVTERTPIAFVRQGGSIGMADASGVLLDIPPDAPGDPNYSFPVVTGLKAEDTPESREQRMHLYSAFLHDLDSEGKKVSSELSEVDLSDPEDVKALIPTGSNETLVHFGTESFLARYKRFQEHIGEWRSLYPRLSSVDMRYERQVVLQMPPKDSTLSAGPEAIADAKPDAKTGAKPAATKLATKVAAVGTKVATNHPVAPADMHLALGAPTKPAPATVVPETAMPRPVVHRAEAVPAKHAAKAEPRTESRREPTRSADVAKRVQAIKAWMAKRQAARKAASHAQ